MNSEAALEKQIAHYRRVTSEPRQGIALDLHELSCDIVREGIRQQIPKRTPPKWSGCSTTISNWPASPE
ncbi:MAG: hypothetical protein HY298_02305 [Verrucomicrobia bacterium]|nr:hypothetical protein [Verrucomicrobiota bacterium]